MAIDPMKFPRFTRIKGYDYLMQREFYPDFMHLEENLCVDFADLFKLLKHTKLLKWRLWNLSGLWIVSPVHPGVYKESMRRVFCISENRDDCLRWIAEAIRAHPPGIHLARSL